VIVAKQDLSIRAEQDRNQPTIAVGEAHGFRGYSVEQARKFAERWHPAWTGNRPELLVSFYSDDAYYSDPHVPAGVRGRPALLEYFTRLLARYPTWVWSQTASIPMRDGFVNFWDATIPLAGEELRLSGVCLVVLRDGLMPATRCSSTARRYSTRSPLRGRDR
jgi:hypothetical protein